MKTLLRADWVAPMDRPALRDAAVAFDAGRILAVGEARAVRAAHPDAGRVDLGDVVLLPGLVNAHTHLELTGQGVTGTWAGPLGDWLLALVRRAPPSGDLAGAVARAVGEGVAQCLAFGVTTVGDITRHPALTRPALASGPLRVTSFGEVLALGQRRGLLDERLSAALTPATAPGPAASRLTLGVSPHAPYTVEPAGYARCLGAARRLGLPLATHLAESADEAPFLARHAGPLRRLWDELGAWDDQVPSYEGGPIRFARDAGLLDDPTLLAHVNYCDDDELALLAAGRASVAYCPRTHAYFRHPPHRWRRMLARGVNVAVGTDSCASSPDLNLVDDLRLLRRLAPEVPAESLWQMATLRAARALGVEGHVGSLTPGKAADLVAFAAHGDDPLAAVLGETALPRAVWVGGDRLR